MVNVVPSFGARIGITTKISKINHAVALDSCGGMT
jgi:hypothetical protein